MTTANRLFWILIISIITILSATAEQMTFEVLPGIAALAFMVKTFSLLAIVVVLLDFFRKMKLIKIGLSRIRPKVLTRGLFYCAVV